MNLCSLWMVWQVDQCFQEGQRKSSKLWQLITHKYEKIANFKVTRQQFFLRKIVISKT